MGSVPITPSLIDVSTTPPVNVRVIAGFWRRLLAFLVDGIVTGIPCFIIGGIFYSYLVRAGAEAALLGFAITWIYFSVLASERFDGQTLGHRLLGIEVVKQNGSYLSFEESFQRYAILLGPLLASGFAVILPSFLASISDIVFALMMLATDYLFIFNRVRGQTLHDLVSRTYVVEDGGFGRVEAPRVWSGHWAALAVLAVLVSASMLPPVQRMVMSRGSFPELVAVRNAILESGVANEANVTLITNRTQTGLRITVPEPRSYTHEQAATRIAQIAFLADPELVNRDYLVVIFQQGIAVGFARYSKTDAVGHSIKEWTDLIATESR